MNDAPAPRILVTGSRHWTDRDAIASGLFSQSRGAPATLIHGAALGADSLAAEIAASWGWEVRAFPADWDKYGKAAGPIRNQQMLDEADPDVVIAFPMPDSRGTLDMMNRARYAGIPVVIVDGVP